MKARKKTSESDQRQGAPWLRIAVWLAVPLLLWFALRRVDLAAIWDAVRRLGPVEIGVLVVINSIALALMSSRWWIIIRAYGHRVSLIRIAAYRLAAFSISYFTPGPHFGGEPLQVHLLRRRLRLRGTEAAATVALDKSIELVANFSFLLLGLVVLLALGLFPSLSPIPVLMVAAALLAVPVLHLSAAARGHQPLERLLLRLPSRVQELARIRRLTDLLSETEGEVARFFTRQTGWFVGTLVASAATWVVFVAEYWLMARFLGLPLGGLEAIAALTAARVAFLLPMPGGLGTLEASQVLAVAALGYPASSGAALALVIRARDVLFGGIGLLIGSAAAGERNPLEWERSDPQEGSA